MDKNSTYYYGPPNAFINGGYAMSTPSIQGLETVPYVTPPPSANIYGNAFYGTMEKDMITRQPKGRCIAPLFAVLFLVFLLISIGLVVAWAILSDGFRHVDTRKTDLSADVDPYDYQSSKSGLSESGSTGRGSSQSGAQNVAGSSFAELANGFTKQNTRDRGAVVQNTASGSDTGVAKPVNFPRPETFGQDIVPSGGGTGGIRRREICGSQPCALAAAEILKNMDNTVSPCEDFYGFACGNYKEHHTLPEDKRRINTLGDLNTQLKRQLKVLLESPVKRTDKRSTQLAKTFYQSCMNMDKINKLDLEPLMKLVDQFDQWPVLDPSWSDQDYIWEKQVGELRLRAAVEGVIGVLVYVDMEDSDKKMLTIDQPGLGLGSREYYMKGKNSELVQAYLKYMVDMAVMFGAEQSAAERQMEEVLDFEMLIANISIPEEDRRDHTELYNPMTLPELKEAVKSVDWDSFFEPIISVEGVRIGDDDRINIVGLAYLKKLGNVLQLTRKQAIANYMIGNLIASYVDYLPTKYRKPYQDFRVIFSGVQSDQARWEECVGASKSFMSWPVGAMYVGKHFTPEAKTEMEVLVDNLRRIMKRNLEQAPWMDAGTKQTALAKMHKMGEKIGYPDYVYNETKITEDYVGITLSNVTYFDNVISITLKKVERRFKEMADPVDKTEWGASPAVVNAFYSWSRNEIVFPAGILQFPIFTLGAPRYVNYPRIGMVIGHEVTHGYDDQGRQYGPNGNLKAWWNQQTLDQFTRKANCFIKQYGNIEEPVSKIKLNGKLTVGENIADNGGLRISYDAYNLWKQTNRNTSEPDLPGLQNFTNDQLFFISFANGWCEMVRPKAIEFYITMDVHSLGRYRVNVPLKNFPAFSRAFQCGTGTQMNPRQKCRVW